jgi:nucleoside-diphosphate-sugar epimerase
LITGGAGYIGSHRAEVYFDRGDEVHTLDDPSAGIVGNNRRLRGRAGLTCTIDGVHNRVVAERVDRCDVAFRLRRRADADTRGPDPVPVRV